MTIDVELFTMILHGKKNKLISNNQPAPTSRDLAAKAITNKSNQNTMQTYSQLIEEKYLVGTPKQQWASLEKLYNEASEAFVLRHRMAVLLEGLKGTPDHATLGNIRNLLETSLRQIDAETK